MAEVTIYLARAMVVLVIYTGSALVKQHEPSRGRLVLDKICPAKIRKALLDAFVEVAEVAVAVLFLHWIGVFE